jgi:hypothetical protein
MYGLGFLQICQVLFILGGLLVYELSELLLVAFMFLVSLINQFLLDLGEGTLQFF